MKAVILGPSSRGPLEFLWRQVGQSGQSGQPPYTGCGDMIFLTFRGRPWSFLDRPPRDVCPFAHFAHLCGWCVKGGGSPSHGLLPTVPVAIPTPKSELSASWMYPSCLR